MQITIAIIELLLVGMIVVVGLALYPIAQLVREGKKVVVGAEFEPLLTLAFVLVAYLIGILVHRLFDAIVDVLRWLLSQAWRGAFGSQPTWLLGRVSERALEIRMKLKDSPDVASRLDFLAFLSRVYRASFFTFLFLGISISHNRDLFGPPLASFLSRTAFFLSTLALLSYFYQLFRLRRLFDFLSSLADRVPATT